MHVLTPRFRVRFMLVSPEALIALIEAKEDPKTLVLRHLEGDWGDVGPEEWAENEHAVRHGGRLFSVFHTRHGRKLYLVTEANRYATTILVPRDDSERRPYANPS